MPTTNRYRCVADCTMDCGHCKGNPPPERTVWVYRNKLPRTLDEPPFTEFTTERQDREELYSETVRAYSDEEACAIIEAEHKRDVRFILMEGEDTR